MFRKCPPILLFRVSGTGLERVGGEEEDEEAGKVTGGEESERRTRRRATGERESEGELERSETEGTRGVFGEGRRAAHTQHRHRWRGEG